MLPRITSAGVIIWISTFKNHEEIQAHLNSAKPFVIYIKCSELDSASLHKKTETYPVKIWPKTIEGIIKLIDTYEVGTIVTFCGIMRMGLWICQNKLKHYSPYVDIEDKMLQVILVAPSKLERERNNIRGNSGITSSLKESPQE